MTEVQASPPGSPPAPSGRAGAEGPPLIAPYGGALVEPMVDAAGAAELSAASLDWPSWTLTERQLSDLELLLNGAFSPLSGFMGRSDYEGVRDHMRLADGTLWPLPISLDVPEPVAAGLRPGGRLALRDDEGALLAVLRVGDVWEPDPALEAARVLGTTSAAHPGADHLLARTHPVRVGGSLEGLDLPRHHDFQDLRLTPAALREALARQGWRRVVAFQTRNPMHRAHLEITLAAAEEARANLLLHPVVGPTQPGDVDRFTRVRCYRTLMDRYPPGVARLAVLNLAMRMAGPREAVLHAIVRRNHGCSHLIVGRDHASPEPERGRPFYAPYAAQELLREVEGEVGVEPVAFREVVWVEASGRHLPLDRVPPGETTRTLSGSELRARLADGREIPEWFTFPEVAAELRRHHPPRARQGFTVFLTGLPASGKSTLGHVLRAKLLELGGRSVTLLDGDVVRRHLSSELGFSREHRDLNVRRIGFVAAEVTRAGGAALCAPIAPYDAARRENRALISSAGGYLLVYLATPLAVCEARDRKGLYARARAGKLAHLTGVDDPYEPPEDADLVIDTTDTTAEAAAHQVLLHLQRQGYLPAEGGAA